MLGISISSPSVPGALLCQNSQQQEGTWSPRASTAKALGKGSHPYKGHIHSLQCLQHWVPPSAQSQEEHRCHPAPVQGTWVATDCHSAVPSVPWRHTLGWGTARSSTSPEGEGIPGELPGNSCLSPTSDISAMHLLHQLKACPDQRSGQLPLPRREEAHVRKSSQASSLQAAASIQTQRCHPNRNGHTDTPAKAHHSLMAF